MTLDQSEIKSIVRYGIPVVVFSWVMAFIYTHNGKLGIDEGVVRVVFDLGKHSDLHTGPGVGLTLVSEIRSIGACVLSR